MSTPYTYYTVTPKSDADRICRDRIYALEAQRKAAKKFGDKWLKGVDYHVVANDSTVVGLAPKDMSWQDFRKKLGENFPLWVEKEDKNVSWIRPRVNVPGNPQAAEMNEDWAKIPVIEGWDNIAIKLFGMGRFVDGMRVYNMFAQWDDKVRIVGIPWLAVQGAMVDFGSGKLSIAKGLKPIAYEKALNMLYGDRVIKARREIAKKDKERKEYEKKRAAEAAVEAKLAAKKLVDTAVSKAQAGKGALRES